MMQSDELLALVTAQIYAVLSPNVTSNSEESVCMRSALVNAKKLIAMCRIEACKETGIADLLTPLRQP